MGRTSQGRPQVIETDERDLFQQRDFIRKMLVGRGMTDLRSTRHLTQDELPIFVLMQHRHGGVNQRTLQISVVIRTIDNVRHWFP